MVCRTLRRLEQQQQHEPASELHEQIVSHQKVLQHVAAEAPAAAMQSLLRLAMRAHLPGEDKADPDGGGGGGGGGPSLGVQELVPLAMSLHDPEEAVRALLGSPLDHYGGESILHIGSYDPTLVARPSAGTAP